MAKKSKSNTEEFSEKTEEKLLNEKEKGVNFFRSKKFRRALGLIFILFSCYLLVAFTSFLFTWQNDQSVVKGASWSILLDTNPDLADNWLGITGAILSNIFIHNGFGIASFTFVLLFFLVGVKLFSGYSVLPIRRTFAYSFFGIIWGALVMGYFFHDFNFILGGSFGYFGYLWFKGMLGSVGTGLFLLAFLAIFSTVVFNTDFAFLKKLIPSLPKKKEKSPESEIAEAEDLAQMELDEDLEEDEPFIIEPVVPTGNQIIQNDQSVEDESDEMEETVDEPIVLSNTISSRPKDDLTNLSFQVEDTTKNEDLISEKEIERINERLEKTYDPTLELSRYVKPTLDLLSDYPNAKSSVDAQELEQKKNMILDTLKNYNIEISSIKATIGPTVTLYEIVPQAGVRIAKIKNLEDDIALSLAALGIRIIAPMPGKGTIGIEVPNAKPEMVPMKSILMSPKYQTTDFDLPIVLGKTISNEVFIADLSKMPHLLMAGATGQGKSVGLNTLLVSLLYKKHPAEVKFVLVDPKKVELSLYKKIENHFLAKLPGDADAIITDTSLVVHTLKSLCLEMDQRYELLKHAEVRNIKEYNKKFLERRLLPTDGHRYLPYIVLVIDELADLMMTAGKEVEMPIARLAQLARAIGIHLVLATQRPSVNIITGTIKANFPARLAFRVISKVDSRTILDYGGAEQLVGRGDMLFSNGNDLIRIQCPFVDTPEVERIATFIGDQQSYGSPSLLPEYVDENAEKEKNEFDPKDRDPLFEDAARIIVQTQQGSTSLLQRRMNLGYNRAGRLIDQMEATGIVGPNLGSKARQVLIPDFESLERLLQSLL